MLRFSANLSMLWREVPFLERFQRAADAGFGAVEFLWPRGEGLDAVVRAKERAGLVVALHNMDAGDMPAGDRGYANDAARRDEWRAAFLQALELAERLGCTRLNCLVGNDLGTASRAAQLDVVRDNLAWALPHAEKVGVTLMLEALNTFESPRYLLACTADSLALIEKLNSPWIKLQYDVYHMQRMEGNLIPTIKANVARIGHVQIADPPGRHQPGSGEINWRNVLVALEEAGYDGYIGLEYVPLGTTEESLAWLPRERRRVSGVTDLNL